ncbi:hypothetical protein ABZ652_24360 [Micromonospora chalcea]|uniref:WD40 repeat domain-containing protein n=1 Tax=Micromonospora chalcea TaxID=1874 RepID=UPI0004C2C983|nr:hypothetical protein [Micromonospora purpureochromogenes]
MELVGRQVHITLLVTVGHDQVVRLWDPHTLRPADGLHGHTGLVFAVGNWTRPDGTTLLVTAGQRPGRAALGPHTLRPAGELHGHTSPVNAVGTSARSDGTTLLITAGHDACILTWKPANGSA